MLMEESGSRRLRVEELVRVGVGEGGRRTGRKGRDLLLLLEGES